MTSFIKQIEDSLRNLEGGTMRGFHRTRIFRSRRMSSFMKQNIEISEQPREANFERAQWTRVAITQRTELLRNTGTTDNLTNCPSSRGSQLD